MLKTLHPRKPWSKAVGLAMSQAMLAMCCSSITYAAPDRDNLGKPAPLQLEEKAVDKTISGKIVDDTNSPYLGLVLY